ncbi:MAG: type II toxin-antitoxin system HicB family antitoxin [Roseitalea porphyridii]|uniref:type II toxin-antitoxin system HicB family antitoxin n=1 Tax=Roseitalea porphyridii TaxID=1852022 RepID=UPI0032D93CCA
MCYPIVIKIRATTFSAYVPDLPGCVATGTTAAEAKTEIAAAIRFHIEGLTKDGLPVPVPQMIVTEVDVSH